MPKLRLNYKCTVHVQIVVIRSLHSSLLKFYVTIIRLFYHNCPLLNFTAQASLRLVLKNGVIEKVMCFSNTVQFTQNNTEVINVQERGRY